VSPRAKRKRGAEPIWLSRNLVDAMHTDLIERYGGLAGVLDEGLVESALARPKNLLAHRPASDLAALAASLTFELAKNHGYQDGNKRTAFVAAAVFLRINGVRLVVGEPEVVIAVLCLATDEWSEERYAKWVREHSAPRP
jgi:death-on-curing protein